MPPTPDPARTLRHEFRRGCNWRWSAAVLVGSALWAVVDYVLNG